MTPNDTAPAPRRRAPLWMKITLVLSLSLNLIIFGAMAARMWYGFSFSHMRAMHAPGAMLSGARGLIRALPPSRRVRFREFYNQRRPRIEQSRRSVAETRRRLAEIIAREPFDQKDFDQALEKLQNAETRAHELIMSIRADLVRTFTPEERRAYARRLLHRPKWRRHGP
jgi:uncharacterized membrane protein